jgi:hypothetical protein
LQVFFCPIQQVINSDQNSIQHPAHAIRAWATTWLLLPLIVPAIAIGISMNEPANLTLRKHPTEIVVYQRG